ncbi:unnamed protein product [Pocillopora meandrina]|uniref:Uncharacterized protein n=1 Tax=Pocillopora meandrina TaxID=46732 RepID=A0AAU9XHP5_9CNID|nr:unnamed protein product [Pocillopora meandrina]
MAGYEPEEPELSDDSKYCQAVRIGRDNKGAELTIFYTPNEGYQIHNGYLAEEKESNSHGRRYDKLTIVTSRGKKIEVRRYEDDEEFEVMSQGYWISQKDVEL